MTWSHTVIRLLQVSRWVDDSSVETIDGIPSSPKEDNYIYNYEAVASEYNEVEEELDRILSEHPSFDALADEM